MSQLLNINLRIHLQTLCSKTCLKIYFSTNFPQTMGKMTNQRQTTGSCVKIVCKIEKSSCKYGREQKFRRAPTHWAANIPCVCRKKPTEDGSQRTVCKSLTNYTNIVFVNWFVSEMFASVYTALGCVYVWASIRESSSKKSIVKITFTPL